jgi:hypothetical protein
MTTMLDLFYGHPVLDLCHTAKQAFDPPSRTC